MKKNIITRMAPSPTGEMHIGNLRTALYSWLYAHQNNGKFILRIEDTDKKRSNEENIEKIKEILKYFGLFWDEYYCQSERLSIYQYYAHKLVGEGHAYLCQCSEDSKEECHCYLKNEPIANKPYCIKLKVISPTNYSITCKDEIRGSILYNSKELYNIVLLKQDGYPTYHLASIIDDHLMGITDVFRGEEWLGSFPYHKLIYDRLNFPMPNFYHLPLICDENGKKLSKRNGDFSVNSLLKEGILPSTILNYVSLLGWHPSGNEEFLTIEDMLKLFDVKKLNSSAASYDYKKLRNLNLKHAKTEKGIKEYYNVYKNQYDKKRLSHLLYPFQNGININEIMEKIDFALKNINIDVSKAPFFKTLVKEIKNIKKNMFNNKNGILLEEKETKIILSNMLNHGYTNKEIHEWIREALTKEIKGLPADILLSLLTIEELLKIFEKMSLSNI